MQSLKTQSREKLKAEYRTYLSHQRGLADETIYKYCNFVDRFLKFKFGEGPDEVSKITGLDIAEFLQYMTVRNLPFRDLTVVSSMRSFFRFLFQNEKIEKNLAVGIPSTARQGARRIPYHLTQAQVEEFLKAARTLTTFNWIIIT